jgi:hypothetical protein
MPMYFEVEYEVEVEVDNDEVEYEIEYDQGYTQAKHHNFNMGNHGGYNQQPQLTFQPNFSFEQQGSNHQNWGTKAHGGGSYDSPWTGWFKQGGSRTDMYFKNFRIEMNGKIWGSGSDEVGQFQISGKMTPSNQRLTFHKKYQGAHTVVYKGKMEGNHISGGWEIPGNCSGKYQLRLDAPRWTGAFWQNNQPTQMVLDMAVTPQGVSGYGSDEVGCFTIAGETHGNMVNFIKQYWGAHAVHYSGQWHGQQIEGEWKIPGNCGGHFKLHY